MSDRSRSRNREAVSFPPIPKARPKAKASAATAPVKSVCTKGGAIPSWYKAARIAKIQTAHLETPPRNPAEGKLAAFAVPDTTREVASDTRAATTKIKAATKTLGRYSTTT